MDTTKGKVTVDQVECLGRIKVEVKRLYRVKHARPTETPTTLAKPITEVSEKLLKGKAIVNSVG